MTGIQWAPEMPENGRLAQSKAARMEGVARVCDPLSTCNQTLHISLFFDGTNNNDDETNPWRDSLSQTHTNVARLFNAGLHVPVDGIFKFYIAGVGTPFPKIGELTYSTKGKALAKGFDQRCVWGFTRILNAVYYAIRRDPDRLLVPDADVKRLCAQGANGKMQELLKLADGLEVAHKDAFEDGRHNRVIRQIYINVFGFSRGAAGARAFANKLTNEWAPGGKLGKASGRYALPYQVNFMGLFDTVASVGWPDSARAALDIDRLNGHFDFAGDGALNVPDKVRYCYHAFSIHEQRMSFPLDAIRNGKAYPYDDPNSSDPPGVRCEVAYPGVHSDVGGGYAPGDQGKARNGDSSKLSQIPLHDMYIIALKRGVPLYTEKDISKNTDLLRDFTVDPSTIAAFNSWRRTVCEIGSVEDATRFGLAQLLAWRTLRARIGTGDYITSQPFYRAAKEDALTPRKVTLAVEKAEETDPQTQVLKARLAQLDQARAERGRTNRYPMTEVIDLQPLDQDRSETEEALARRKEALCGLMAHPDDPKPARAGEGPNEVGTNDQTDMREGAEEMRLLLGYLHPEQRELWQVRETERPQAGNAYPTQAPPQLSVKHEQPKADSPRVTLVEGGIAFHSTRTTLVQKYDPVDDVLAVPLPKVVRFLKEHTSAEAVAKLDRAAIALFDDYVHDSRCWFRVPYFHEYAPGGYGWPRVVFAGGDERARYLALAPILKQLEDGARPQSAFA